MPSRFDYVKYDVDAVLMQDSFKSKVAEIEKNIGALGINSIMRAKADQVDAINSLSRSKAMALTKLEEFYMWVGKAVRDDQIVRNGSAPLQEERKNG